MLLYDIVDFLIYLILFCRYVSILFDTNLFKINEKPMVAIITGIGFPKWSVIFNALNNVKMKI